MGSLRPIVRRKKSQGFESWFMIIVFLLAAAIVLLVVNKAWSSISEPLDEGLSSAMTNDTVNVSNTISQTGGSTLMFDSLLPFLIIGVFGFIMISAGAIMRHPIMIFVGLIVFGVVITLAVVYSNLYNEISSTDEFTDTKENLSITDKFMQYLPFLVIIGVIAIGAMVIMRNPGGGGGL